MRKKPQPMPGRALPKGIKSRSAGAINPSAQLRTQLQQRFLLRLQGQAVGGATGGLNAEKAQRLAPADIGQGPAAGMPDHTVGSTMGIDRQAALPGQVLQLQQPAATENPVAAILDPQCAALLAGGAPEQVVAMGTLQTEHGHPHHIADAPIGMQGMAELLAARGVSVLRFEFPYMAARRADGGKRPPNPQAQLLECWRQVYAVVRGQVAGPLAIGGKSMGGRMASLLADELQADALVCLGYPFHAVGKQDKPRVAHLAELRTPTLIIQGERDSLGNREAVQGYD